jgi:hypothetical protein
MGCGSTIGPILAGGLGMPTVGKSHLLVSVDLRTGFGAVLLEEHAQVEA